MVVNSSSVHILEEAEILSLLSLQKINLKSNISKEEALAQGFLTFPYSEDEVRKMLKEMPQPVIKMGNEIKAYALSCTQKVCQSISLLKPMIELCTQLEYNGKNIAEYNYYVMGQICIAEELRGKGVFDSLYQQHKALFGKEYDFVVTEISEANRRSCSAHQRVGFQKIHHYFDGETQWNLVLWDWN